MRNVDLPNPVLCPGFMMNGMKMIQKEHVIKGNRDSYHLLRRRKAAASWVAGAWSPEI